MCVYVCVKADRLRAWTEFDARIGSLLKTLVTTNDISWSQSTAFIRGGNT